MPLFRRRRRLENRPQRPGGTRAGLARSHRRNGASGHHPGGSLDAPPPRRTIPPRPTTPFGRTPATRGWDDENKCTPFGSRDHRVTPYAIAIDPRTSPAITVLGDRT